MNVAKVPFTVMQFLGIWQPKSWTSKWAIYCYGFYKILIISAFMPFALTLFIYVLKFDEDLYSLTENLMVLSAFFSVGMKIISILVNREKIIAFDNLFLESICIPRDSEEVALQNGFERADRMQSISFISIWFLATAIGSLSPLILSSSRKPLPCDKIWIPYSLDSRLFYWLTYCYQAAMFMTLTLIIAAVDFFLFSTLQRICNQLEIFKHRLHLLPTSLEKNNQKKFDKKRELTIIEDWILYHTHIYTIGKRLNDIFSLTIFGQFFVTTVALCMIIYHLAKDTLFSSSFWFMLGSLNNYMLEIFFYCWFGEGLICKSLEIATTVYEMNWNLLTINSKRCLLIIMIRARRPIELIGASMVTMSLETLVKIIKVSYSAFSVLRSSD